MEECHSEMAYLDSNIGSVEVNLFHFFIQQVFVELCDRYFVGYRKVQLMDYGSPNIWNDVMGKLLRGRDLLPDKVLG